MLFEEFRPLDEMSIPDIIDEYIRVTQEHRNLKIQLRDIHRWMQKCQAGPANVYRHMEDLATREHLGKRKQEIQQYFNHSRERIRRDAKLHWGVEPKAYRTAKVREINSQREELKKQIDAIPAYSLQVVEPPDSTGIEVKVRKKKFIDIPQIWEGGIEQLAALAGTAHVDFPLGWGKPKGNPEVEVQPFHKHISIFPTVVELLGLAHAIIKPWQIWSDGKRSTGIVSPVQLLDTIEATSFDEAVKKYAEKEYPNVAERNCWFIFENGYWSTWGCRLFDNETDAQDSHNLKY